MLSTLAERLGGKRFGVDVEVSMLSTDTRTLKKGDAYLALVGENFNGNKFVNDAFSKGAVAAIISESGLENSQPLIQVKDTHQACLRNNCL